MSRATVIVLIAAVSLLAALGIVMLASTSYYVEETGGEAYFTLKQQGMWMTLAIAGAATMALVHYQWLYRLRWWIYGVSAVLLVFCFLPVVGVEVNGASRWISLKALGMPWAQFQPSELAKVACAIVIAGWFARHEPLTREFKAGFIIPSCLVGVLVVLVGMEVDLGTAALIGTLGVCMMFVAGTRWWYLGPVAAVGLTSLVWVIKFMPNRVERIMAFMDLEKYKDGLGLQQWRALIAFGSGGVDGVGWGNGRQKMGYVPESVTDFIFPMVGEELGFIGTSLVVLLFALIIVAGMRIAHKAADRFGQLLAYGLTVIIALEALINMGVTTSLLPNKGLPLPFVSKGGSSLLFAMISVGILISIHRRGLKQTPRKDLMLTRRRRISAVPHGTL